jgi:lipoprotein NlpD
VIKLVLHTLLCCLLLACGGSNYRAPVEDRTPRQLSVPDIHYVQRGETLYSIAWRYGLDYRRLAAANDIDGGYRIYPGQQLFLKKAPPSRHSIASSQSPSKPAGAGTTAAAKTAATVPGKSSPAPGTRSSSPPAQSNTSAGSAGATVTSWLWPSPGKVIRRYSSTLHKGIDIEGQRGDPVKAVAAGRVVYAGTGIVGFGELLIIKHDEIYLSAYGHNDRLLVAEGDAVRAGQLIANKGSSGTNSVKLHFEIRREGKPVDPMKLLKKR